MASLTAYAQRGLLAVWLLAVGVASAGPEPAGAPTTPATSRLSAAEKPLRTADQVRPVTIAAPALPPGASTSTPVLVEVPPTLTVAGVPPRAMTAYLAAADRMATEDPRCRVPWPMLAAIGYVESDHGTVHGGAIGPDGRATPIILGPRLDGTGAFALIRDSDGGALDGDKALDRAVGPMQFIPSTWARSGADGDGDGRNDPHDIDDAALAAGRYLCAASRRLDTPANRIPALFSYNRSYDYVRIVLTVAARYAGQSPQKWGVGLVPATVASPSPTPTPTPAPTETLSPTPVPRTETSPGPSAEPTGTPGSARPAAPTGSPAAEPVIPLLSPTEPVESPAPPSPPAPPSTEPDPRAESPTTDPDPPSSDPPAPPADPPAETAPT